MKLLRHGGKNQMLVLRVLGIWLCSQHDVVIGTFYVSE